MRTKVNHDYLEDITKLLNSEDNKDFTCIEEQLEIIALSIRTRMGTYDGNKYTESSQCSKVDPVYNIYVYYDTEDKKLTHLPIPNQTILLLHHRLNLHKMELLRKDERAVLQNLLKMAFGDEANFKIKKSKLTTQLQSAIEANLEYIPQQGISSMSESEKQQFVLDGEIVCPENIDCLLTSDQVRLAMFAYDRSSFARNNIYQSDFFVDKVDETLDYYIKNSHKVEEWGELLVTLFESFDWFDHYLGLSIKTVDIKFPKARDLLNQYFIDKVNSSNVSADDFRPFYKIKRGSQLLRLLDDRTDLLPYVGKVNGKALVRWLMETDQYNLVDRQYYCSPTRSNTCSEGPLGFVFPRETSIDFCKCLLGGGRALSQLSEDSHLRKEENGLNLFSNFIPSLDLAHLENKTFYLQLYKEEIEQSMQEYEKVRESYLRLDSQSSNFLPRREILNIRGYEKLYQLYKNGQVLSIYESSLWKTFTDGSVHSKEAIQDFKDNIANICNHHVGITELTVK